MLRKFNFAQPPWCVEGGVAWLHVGGVLPSPAEEERAECGGWRCRGRCSELDMQLKPPPAVEHSGICSLPAWARKDCPPLTLPFRDCHNTQHRRLVSLTFHLHITTWPLLPRSWTQHKFIQKRKEPNSCGRTKAVDFYLSEQISTLQAF